MEPIKILLKNPDLLQKHLSDFLLVKIEVGEKYQIWKVQKIKTVTSALPSQLDREVKIPDNKSIFYNMVKYIRRKKITELRVEILKGYQDRYQLLVDEYELLMNGDKNLLNEKNNIDHYPKWIPQDDINRFKVYYTKGKNTGSSAKDKNLNRFLSTLKIDQETKHKIYNYLKTRYK